MHSTVLIPLRIDPGGPRAHVNPRRQVVCVAPDTEVSTTQEIRLHLFVAGTSPRALRAIGNLKRLVEEAAEEHCDVEVIDVLTAPDRLEAERILATPTLIRSAPPPRRRVTGDLSDLAAVLDAMGMSRTLER